MKVLFLTYLPSPYRVDFFNEIGKKCELTVVFEKASASHRDNSWKKYQFKNFNGIVFKDNINDFVPKIEVIKYLKKISFDDIIVHNVSTPTGMLAIQYMKNHNIPYWIESDGGIVKAGGGIKETIKKHFIKGAKGYFSSSKSCDEYFLKYGAEPDRIVRYPFAAFAENYILEEPLHVNDKQRLRDKLGIVEEKMVISVGRFSYLNGYGKGYDAILRAATRISPSVGWYVVGGEPTKEFENMRREMNLTNVHFIDFKSKDKLREFYQASDLFVLMTVGDVWGLVINEAMASGLPIITTERCVAGMELVVNGVNGYVVKVGDDTELAKVVTKILFENGTVDNMGRWSLKKISDYTIEKMADTHIKWLGERQCGF